MGTIVWRKAKVGLDNDRVYEAEVMDETHWNGFACPRFTREVTERIVRDLECENARLISEGYDPADCTQFKWIGDDLVMTEAAGTPDEWTEEVGPDADGMYHVGSHAWVWTEIKSA